MHPRVEIMNRNVINCVETMNKSYVTRIPRCKGVPTTRHTLSMCYMRK